MNWSYIQEVLPLFGKAALLTVRIGLIGILFAILVGLLCSLIRQLKIPVLRTVVSVYIELSRNTPLLIQLFFIYYGLPKIGIRTSAEACGVAGLAFLGGSYMAEAFRSGLEAVGKIQHESALSLGLTGVQTFRYVILPQAFAISIPERFFRDQPDGPDVHGEGSDRPVLQHDGMPVPAGCLLSGDPAPCIAAGKPAGKEGPACRVWDLRCCSRERTLNG